MNSELGIWLVRKESEELAVFLQQHLSGQVFMPWLDTTLAHKEQFAAVFHLHRQWIMIAASGIAVRFISPLIKDKQTDPAVVVLDEVGRFAISLLAGHEGGANELAYRVANATGAVPIVTTATEALKPFVVGIGCRKNIAVQQITDAVQHALMDRNICEIREIVTIDLKAKEPGLLEFCEQYNLPLKVLSRTTVAARAWVNRPSEWVQKSVGLDGVCEPCALIASSRGQLIVPKLSLDGVAVAVVDDSQWVTQL